MDVWKAKYGGHDASEFEEARWWRMKTHNAQDQWSISTM
jgi:hypothetical protein